MLHLTTRDKQSWDVRKTSRRDSYLGNVGSGSLEQGGGASQVSWGAGDQSMCHGSVLICSNFTSSSSPLAEKADAVACGLCPSPPSRFCCSSKHVSSIKTQPSRPATGLCQCWIKPLSRCFFLILSWVGREDRGGKDPSLALTDLPLWCF